ncbi:MAG: DUF4058 family protein [Leptospiraceae bacterium]|nr:DUF4058 family protein [Leptospiraceae bacterium]MCP5496886.1 DUF4058 family protein [Leptospiraceae bacterium]
MQQPFPGMDPYLEGEMWQEFHTTLANQIRSSLLQQLPSKYTALLNKRYVIEQAGLSLFDIVPKQIFYPDINVSELNNDRDTSIVKAKKIATPSITLFSPIPEKVPVLRVEIRDIAKRRLVTVVEILSPANKQGKGYWDYMEKRGVLMQTNTHLLELDLLRLGKRLPLLGGKLPDVPYFVFLSRFTHRPATSVWPIELRETLPSVPVPLLPPDPDIILDLQTALEDCFKLVGYQRLLDYSIEPPPPLFSESDLEWIKSKLADFFTSKK